MFRTIQATIDLITGVRGLAGEGRGNFFRTNSVVPAALQSEGERAQGKAENRVQWSPPPGGATGPGRVALVQPARPRSFRTEPPHLPAPACRAGSPHGNQRRTEIRTDAPGRPPRPPGRCLLNGSPVSLPEPALPLLAHGRVLPPRGGQGRTCPRLPGDRLTLWGRDCALRVRQGSCTPKRKGLPEWPLERGGLAGGAPLSPAPTM